MKKQNKNFVLVLVIGLLVGIHLVGCAQNNNSMAIEGLKGLQEVSPFAVKPEQLGTFSPKNSQEIYFEDGSKLSFNQYGVYLRQPDYISIPYINPASNKITAMLVRKATPEEKEKRKNFIPKGVETMATADDPPAANKEGSAPLKLDPNITAEKIIKSNNLKKITGRKSGSQNINLNEVAIFDENGKQLPNDVKDENGKPGMNPELMKRFRDKNLAIDTYVDENEKIRAQVFRQATPEEQAAKQLMMEKAKNTGVEEKRFTSNKAGFSGEPGRNMVNDPAELVNKKAPELTLKDINGKDVSLEKLKGKVVVLNFWFTQCAPCKKEMPELNELVNKYKGKNVEFVALCTNDKETLVEYLKSQKFGYRQVADAMEAAFNYGVTAYPANIVIDQESIVRTVKTGFSSGISSSLSEAIEECLKK